MQEFTPIPKGKQPRVNAVPIVPVASAQRPMQVTPKVVTPKVPTPLPPVESVQPQPEGVLGLPSVESNSINKCFYCSKVTSVRSMKKCLTFKCTTSMCNKCWKKFNPDEATLYCAHCLVKDSEKKLKENTTPSQSAMEVVMTQVQPVSIPVPVAVPAPVPVPITVPVQQDRLRTVSFDIPKTVLTVPMAEVGGCVGCKYDKGVRYRCPRCSEVLCYKCVSDFVSITKLPLERCPACQQLFSPPTA
jgi:hypothetical protein